MIRNNVPCCNLANDSNEFVRKQVECGIAETTYPASRLLSPQNSARWIVPAHSLALVCLSELLRLWHVFAQNRHHANQ